MAEKRVLPTGGHAAVSSQSFAAADFPKVTTAVSEPPSPGKSAAASATPADGWEGVEGWKPRAARAAAADEPALAPDTSHLRDIAEASFGPPPARARIVHGADDRVQITTTHLYPWSAHASLLITAADGSEWIGTGWFIGPHTLMTAGHVVFIRNSGVPGRDGWVQSVLVMPGRNGSSLPFGSVTSSDLRSVQGWTRDGNQDYDYGAIVLSTDLGVSTGYFGFGVYTDGDLLASFGNIAGYPGDKPDGTQWYAANRIDSVNSRKVFYDIDTAGGQSGCAVYRIKDGKRYGIAIHAHGGATTNSGPRIITPVYNNMVTWKA